MISSGQKTIEVRVAYPKNRTLSSGDLLEFFSGDETCLTRVVRITEYISFEIMLDSENPGAIGFPEDESRDQMLASIRAIYPPAKEALGVLAIEVMPLAVEPA